MDPRLIIILASAFVAVAGYICVAPDQFGFLRLPQAFLQFGAVRSLTGLSLMLLGFIVALSEVEGGQKPKRRRPARPFAFGGEDLAPATGELRLEPEAPVSQPVARPLLKDEPEPLARKRRPDLYEDIPEDDAAAVPKPDNPPPPEP